MEKELNDVIEKIASFSIAESIEKPVKGANCSKQGNKYEEQVLNVINKTYLNNEKFSTQNKCDLGGSTCGIDLLCNFKGKNIGIEVKKYNTPDWMQVSLKYDKDDKRWYCATNNKIPESSKMVFEKIIQGILLFDGKVPPFFDKLLTHEEWLKIKKDSNDWKDCYIDIPEDTIKKIYAEKGCQYIQISEYGLYHLGNDTCQFGVQEFIIPQRLRIRIKVHTRKTIKGFCKLSVMAACQPIKIKTLNKSIYSLDNKIKLPTNLIYQE
jgi:hypothetical protein